MEKRGSVSVWIGRGVDRVKFEQLLEYHIAEEGLGDFVASRFCQEYGIGSYDPDQFGGRYFAKEIGYKLLFHETAFAEEIAADCANFEPSNCYVLLHDYAYEGANKDVELDGFSFTFVGVYDY